MIILITNDDGINSEGLKALEDSLKDLGMVITVAPDRERSAASHSLTLDRPLGTLKISEEKFAVDGTPTDCVNLAINSILPELPALLVSGINKGPNLGEDISYSGTVSAAIEGTFFGIPSFAISLVARENYNFSIAADFARRISLKILVDGLPENTLLNVNVPNLPVDRISSYRITRQGNRTHRHFVTERSNPDVLKNQWLGEEVGIDFMAIRDNCVSITPLKLDLTDYESIQMLKKWEL